MKRLAFFTLSLMLLFAMEVDADAAGFGKPGTGPVRAPLAPLSSS